MTKQFLTGCALLALLLIGVVCSKFEKNPVGAQFFQRDNWGSENVLRQVVQQDTFYKSHTPAGASHALFVGETRGTRSISFLQFTSLPDSGIVDSAFVKLYTRDHIGGITGNFQATVHAVTQPWDESTLTRDTYNAGMIGDVLDTLTFSIDDLVAENDSMEVSFRLPPDLVQNWMDSTRANENQGLVIQTSEPDTGFIVEFFSYEEGNATTRRPKLTLYAHHDSTTAIYIKYPSDDTFIADSDIEGTPNHLFVGNGSVLRTLIRFPVDVIDRAATINRAQLTLFSDTTLSFPDNSQTMGISSCTIESGAWPLTEVGFDTLYALSNSITGDSTVINITMFVQKWTSENGENMGIILVGQNEIDTFTRRAFYSTASPIESRRPKIEIFYTLPPSSRL